MIADINKYKKLDKELTTLRQKHTELEKDSQRKLSEMTKERDDLQVQYEQLQDKLRQYEQTKNSPEELQQQIEQLKIENNQIRQSNWKGMDEVNKSSNSRSKNVSQS